MRSTCTSILGLLLVLTTCTAVSLHRRIVGGRLMNTNEHDFLVSLWFMPDNMYTKHTKMHHVCGGALIAPSWVLTAAHCYDAIVNPGLNETKNWFVALGFHNQRNLEDSHQLRRVKAVHIYPAWTFENITGDAALLELNRPVDLSRDGVAVIDYDTNPLCAAPGSPCHLLGWGQPFAAPYGYGMAVPAVGEMPVVDDRTCREAFKPENVGGKEYFFDDLKFCAGPQEEHVSGCYGDSGGPLVCNCDGTDVVSGIFSMTYWCGRNHTYGIFTRVSLLKDWIQEVMTGHDPQPVEQSHAVL